MSKTMSLVPKISEKALSKTSEKLYVFMVPKKAAKNEIKRAVEAQFEVTVGSVRTVVAKGKAKTSVRKRLQPLDGRRANRKKAYVHVTKGSIATLEES